MKRREWLRGAITAPALAVAVSQTEAAAQTPPPANSDNPKLSLTAADALGAANASRFLPEADYKTLEALADVLMPAYNERPGAVSAKVPQFLDFLLSESPADRQALYRDGLGELSRLGFTSMSAADRKKTLTPLEQPWTYDAPKDPLARFLRVAKDDIVQATFNSREWATSSKTRNAGGTSYYYFTIE